MISYSEVIAKLSEQCGTNALKEVTTELIVSPGKSFDSTGIRIDCYADSTSWIEIHDRTRYRDSGELVTLIVKPYGNTYGDCRSLVKRVASWSDIEPYLQRLLPCK